MKAILSLLCLLFFHASFAQVGVGTATPDTSAQLEVHSNSKGFLPPRLTTLQRDGIDLPATGLVIFNLSDSSLQYNSGTPATPKWERLSIDTGVRSPVIAFRAEVPGNGSYPLANQTFSYRFYDAVQWNDGSAFDSTTGIFTAPVRGLYEFDALGSFLCSAAYGAGVYLCVNDVAYASSFHYQPANPHGAGISVAATVKLNAGDQVRVKVYSTHSTAVVNYVAIGVPGTARTHFGGALIRRF